MGKIETEILSKAVSKPIVWKRYIDYVFSLWDMSKPDMATSIEQANSHHPTIKFTEEISATETVFLRHNSIQRKEMQGSKNTCHINVDLPIYGFHLLSPTKQ